MAAKLYDTTRMSRYYNGPVSDHFDGARFFDPHGAPPRSRRDLLRWFVDRHWRATKSKWPAWAPSPYADRLPARVDGAAWRISLWATVAFALGTMFVFVFLHHFVADDIRLSYPIHLGKLWRRFGEQITLEPTLDIYNVANKANFDPPAGFITSPLRGVLDGSAGAVNGATASTRPSADRYGLGTGVFSQGVPRALEIGLRLSF